MKYIPLGLFLLVFGCADNKKSIEVNYGDSQYMVLDSLHSNTAYVFKNNLPDGEYLAYDFDTVCRLFPDSTPLKERSRKYLRSSASFVDGFKHGDWLEWMFDCFADTTYLSSKTVYDRGFYKQFVAFHPFSEDTFMLNIFPDSALHFEDWVKYTEYSEDELFTTEIIDSANTRFSTKGK